MRNPERAPDQMRPHHLGFYEVNMFMPLDREATLLDMNNILSVAPKYIPQNTFRAVSHVVMDNGAQRNHLQVLVHTQTQSAPFGTATMATHFLVASQPIVLDRHHNQHTMPEPTGFWGRVMYVIGQT